MQKKEKNSSSDQLVDGREGSTAGVEGVSAAGASASDTALSELSLREAACLGMPCLKKIYGLGMGMSWVCLVQTCFVIMTPSQLWLFLD